MDSERKTTENNRNRLSIEFMLLFLQIEFERVWIFVASPKFFRSVFKPWKINISAKRHYKHIDQFDIWPMFVMKWFLHLISSKPEKFDALVDSVSYTGWTNFQNFQQILTNQKIKKVQLDFNFSTHTYVQICSKVLKVFVCFSVSS